MRRRILAIPSVADLSDFSHLVSQTAHYFSHVNPERVVVLVDRELIRRAEEWLRGPTLPASYRRGTSELIDAIRDAIELRRWPCDLDALATASDLVLDCDVSRSGKKPWSSVRSEFRLNRSLFEVDWRGRRLGAAWLAEASKVLSRGRQFGRSGVEKLQQLSQELGRADVCYLVGTGPSARDALTVDLSDGVRIVCNTAIVDDELMDHVKPHIVTFADPIFHFGPSTYAARFQEYLVDQAKERDFLVVTTERYAPLLSAHAPSISERVVGLRQGTRSLPDNFDLIRQPIVRPYPNVLTMLMLPLAASLAHSARLFGFDGRQPDDEYFWKHGRTVQLEEELHEIREVHPGFFDLDYTDYYREHVASVEKMISRLEAMGFGVQSMAHSHMPPLRRRGGNPAAALAGGLSTELPALVSITPDWVDDFGHFGPLERRLHEAADRIGIGHVALASAALQPTEFWQQPIFTDSTIPHSLGRTTGWERFETELSKALLDVEVANDATVAMYSADVWHLPGILSVARDHPSKRFVVNLMRSHDWIDAALRRRDGWLAALVNLLDLCLTTASDSNVEVTADSEALVRDIELLTDHKLRVWPMMVVSSVMADGESNARQDRPFHVVAPVHAQQTKGFADLTSLAVRWRPRLQRGEVRFTVRHVSTALSSSEKTLAMANEIRNSGAVVLEENLTDGQFSELINSADVVLLPYQVRPFRTRTSGVVLDALLAGKPVVTVRGTWAGEIVESHGAGATYDQGHIAQMEEALDQVANSLDSYRERLASVRLAVSDEYAPTRLIEFLRETPGSSAPSAPDAENLFLVHSEAIRLQELHRWHTRTMSDVMLDSAVRDDAHARSADEKTDEIEQLARALRWRDTSGPKMTPLETQGIPGLDQQVFPRTAHANIDEVGLIARLFEADGRGAGRMIDVGAHHGSAFRQLLARNWLIHAFEPDEVNAEYLEERFGDDERVTIDRRACIDKSRGRHQFYRSDESTGVSSLTPFLGTHESAGHVDTVALRDVVGDRHCDFLKVDAEGHDLKVLEGYPWDSDRPDVVLCEFEDRKTRQLGYSVADLAEFLVVRGYQVWMSEWHPVLMYGTRHDWYRLQRYPCETSGPDSWGNLIAFRKPRRENQMAAALEELVEVSEEFTGDSAGTSTNNEPDRPAAAVGQAPVAASAVDNRKRTVPARARSFLRAALPTLKGFLGIGLGLTAGSVAVSLVLVAFGWIVPALILIGTAVLGSGLTCLVVAVRLERKTTARPLSRSRSSDPARSL